MRYTLLPNSTLKISQLGLGTMTFGVQNTLADAFEQLNYAIANGINLIDTAEMYPVPPSKETYGLTEEYIGQWIEKFKKRGDVILATKIIGPVRQPDTPIRNSQRLDKLNIQQALNSSLKRLKTDYIDLYQLHWPERKTNIFGQLTYNYPTDEEKNDSFLETLEALNDEVKAGKIRYIGVSNETPYGLMRYLNLAKQHNLPKVLTIQNPYSLLNRTFEVALSEICYYEDVKLLAYSCLGFGTLTGKYLNGQKPEGARNTLFNRFVRYSSEQAIKATEAYVALAHEFGLSPAVMSLAYVNNQPFNASTILGATTLKQLRENIDSLNVTLSQDLLIEINRIHTQYPFPSP
ncbi:NADP(H)-dependent aldo-keto reductase [Thorsellia kenyensis]|uniref:NADP(H)-dependent aldo-keto reductase n=1 Tax=Thorsellia kenyensis TaxID=1549888 RepID=A0ABV6CBZ2_9GAMM